MRFLRKKEFLLAMFMAPSVLPTNDTVPEALKCPVGTLKVARCQQQNTSEAANHVPVKALVVCVDSKREFAMTSIWAVNENPRDDILVARQPVEAKRLNASQILYKEVNTQAALVLNGDRKGGSIQVCDTPGADGKVICEAREAICE